MSLNSNVLRCHDGLHRTVVVDYLPPASPETCTESKRKILASFCPGLVLFHLESESCIIWEEFLLGISSKLYFKLYVALCLEDADFCRLSKCSIVPDVRNRDCIFKVTQLYIELRHCRNVSVSCMGRGGEEGGETKGGTN